MNVDFLFMTKLTAMNKIVHVGELILKIASYLEEKDYYNFGKTSKMINITLLKNIKPWTSKCVDKKYYYTTKHKEKKLYKFNLPYIPRLLTTNRCLNIIFYKYNLSQVNNIMKVLWLRKNKLSLLNIKHINLCIYDIFDFNIRIWLKESKIVHVNDFKDININTCHKLSYKRITKYIRFDILNLY